MNTYYVFARRGKPLGLIEAADAIDAQSTANAIHGAGAYVLPDDWRYLTSAERFACCMEQERADAGGT